MTNPLTYITKYVSPTVLKNSGWLILDKVIAALISFIVYFVLANYLGPTTLGEYNYALSVVTIFATFGTLGLDSIIVKDFIDGKYKERNILGSVFFLRCIGSVFVILLSLLVVWVSQHSPLISILTIILSSAYILRSFQVLDSWFLANKNVKPSVIARNIGAIIAAICKILVVVLHLNVIYFAAATSLEFIIAVLTLLSIYKSKYHGEITKWSLDWDYIKSLFQRGWIITLGVIFSALASRLDQYLIGTLKGSYDVGLYSPAAKISEFWYFIPAAFIDSVYPSLLEAKKKSAEIYNDKLIKTSSVLFYISVIFALLISIFANVIIGIFLNKSFAESSGVLRIYVWGTLGTVMTSFLLRWLIIEGKQKQLVVASFTNFVLNAILNIILVPKFGIQGAAWATAISYNLGWILVVLVFDTKTLNLVILKSIILPFKVVWNKFIKNNEP